MRFKHINWIGLALMTACAPSGPEPVELPSATGIQYRVLLQTFQDGAYADQPFHLSIKRSGSRFDPKTVLRAQQCKNVSVAQTRDTLYIFYDELSLNRFSSLNFEAADPNVLLCDLHTPLCVGVQRKLAQAGLAFTNVCSYRTNHEE